MAYLHSFPPIADGSAHKLVLGSMPGKTSLLAHQYYAHPRNLFWRIVEEILGISSRLPYETRCEEIRRNGVALWDVLKTCTRTSSLDSDIEEASAVPNDFQGFFHSHPDITAIYFNGAKAAKLFEKHVQPVLPEPWDQLPRIRLPSTSPANASIPLDEKIRQWGVIKEVTHEI